MPYAAPTPCRYSGCPKVTRGAYCEAHQVVAQKRQDERRGSAASRGYGAKWRKARALFLVEHPMCTTCKTEGGLEPATVVDHITPHRGDQRMFWSQSNWQALCKRCHDAKTAREDGGFGNRGRGGAIAGTGGL